LALNSIKSIVCTYHYMKVI